MNSKNRTVKIDNEKITLPQASGEMKFWQFMGKGLDKKEAYIKSHPKCNPKWAATYALKLYKKKKFQPIKDSLWKQFQNDAQGAYDIQKDIMNSVANKPELRNTIADKLLDRAGFSPVAKTAQLKMVKNLDNPLLEKSTEELQRLSEETTFQLKMEQKKIAKLNSGKSNVIEGEIENE